MKLLSRLVALVLPLLAGCVNYGPSIPKDYSGPRAVIKDSATSHSTSKADLFFVEKVAQRPVENTRIATKRMSYGQGLSLSLVNYDRGVPAGQPLTVSLVGRTEHAAPILAITNAEYEVKGDLTFVPTAGTTYVVRGVLGESLAEIWLEEEVGRRVIGEKIKPAGSAKLGFFEK